MRAGTRTDGDARVTAAPAIGTPALWVAFGAFVVAMLALDLGVLRRGAAEVGRREALAWTAFWVLMALVFNAWIGLRFGAEPAIAFLTGYVIEKALSVDNLFVFLAIFGAFGVPPALRHRVLFWGILGALVLRAGFIAAGTALLSTFAWTFYVFGALLVLAGVRLWRGIESGVHPEQLFVVRLMRRVLPCVADYRGARFVVWEHGRRMATPLLVVLFVVEATDVVFALDSIPAVLAITTDPFLVFTSNVFAILGLRSLFFVVSSALEQLRYLHMGLAAVLVFVGGKMLLHDVLPVPVGASLASVTSMIGSAVLLSRWADRRTAGPGRPKTGRGASQRVAA